MPRRRGGIEALNPWPGYVDALSTLLMVIIFVLLVFVLAQAFLSVALTGRTEDLQRLNRQMDELSSLLMSERGHSADLTDQLGKRFEMAGGYIKKAVLRAALMAAETQRALTTADLLEAARHEYREMGRIV